MKIFKRFKQREDPENKDLELLMLQIKQTQEKMKDFMVKLKKKKILFQILLEEKSKNKIKGFYRIVPTIQNFAIIIPLHKPHLSIQRYLREDLFQIIFMRPFLLLSKLV